MLLALGAASFALDALKSLTSSKSSASSPTGSKDSANPFDLSGATSAGPGLPPASGSGGGSQISPATMSALLAAQSQASAGSTTAPASKSDALKDLFSQIDADGNGKLSKAEFEHALGAGGTNVAQADDVFGKMDKDADGSVSLGEMMSALKAGKGGHHHHPHVAASDSADDSSGASGSDSDPLMQALQGASSTSVTNSDGSTTTSLTYADGSKVTMTSAAAASSSATSSYNFIEQMIQRQAQAISSSATASLSVSA
jgi:hypothetical protein